MTIPKNQPFSCSAVRLIQPIMGESEGSSDRDEIPLSKALLLLVVNMPLDEKEQPLTLMPLGNKSVS